uniref:Uncharacterized protein n=1 Tax=viral metagenome TaxID=1070528 RepID=A0A6C0KQ59_9ZZZZ
MAPKELSDRKEKDEGTRPSIGDGDEEHHHGEEEEDEEHHHADEEDEEEDDDEDDDDGSGKRWSALGKSDKKVGRFLKKLDKVSHIKKEEFVQLWEGVNAIGQIFGLTGLRNKEIQTISSNMADFVTFIHAANKAFIAGTDQAWAPRIH